MNVTLYGTDHNQGIRHHPYGGAAYDPRAKYYNFVENPKLIREVLEDFKPFDLQDGVIKLYGFLEWLNGTESDFESTDSRMEPPEANTKWPNVPRRLVLKGRVMIMFRALERNLSGLVAPNDILYAPSQYIDWLGQISQDILSQIAPRHWSTWIDIYYFGSLYENTGLPKYQSYGYQVVYQFTTFADTEKDLFDNLGFFAECMTIAFKQYIHPNAL